MNINIEVNNLFAERGGHYFFFLRAYMKYFDMALLLEWKVRPQKPLILKMVLLSAL